MTASRSALNPRGLVPTVKAKGKPIYESLILNELFEDLFPEAPKLLPTEPVEKARARIWIETAGKIPALHAALVRAQTVEEQDTKRKEYYEALRKLADEKDPSGPYFLGDKFSLVDVTISPWVVRDFVLTEHRGWDRAGAGEKWKAWADAIATRPSVINTSSVSEFPHHREAKMTEGNIQTNEQYSKLYESFTTRVA